MKTTNLVILWHMHQPQYRDPATGEYILPWTRLHALKDYWGMVHLLEQFPEIRVTFNVVPSLARQLREYAAGTFRESWYETALAPAEDLSRDRRAEILLRAFQANYENMILRWPRFAALFEQAQTAGKNAAMARFTARDWRDLQVLSQLAWMDEEFLELDPVVAELSRKGSDFTEEEKLSLITREQNILGEVIPEYRRAQDRGQIEISTTPYYHPILPLLCDSDIARVSNSWTPLPRPAFVFPEDARTQLARARELHTELFGQPPAGLWPSEGSVSDQALEIAIELGFSWFATDEGVLGKTLSIGFDRDASGFAEHAAELYNPWVLERPAGKIHGLFRDHYLSDLIGFVYSRMPAEAAADDMHRRIRNIGERWTGEGSPTVCLILDGENAWEHFPRNGRPFLSSLYERLEGDPEIRTLTASEAIGAAGEFQTVGSIFPASWISANFDIWIGHAEDVHAWELLGDARRLYAQKAALQHANEDGAPTPDALATAFESILAAEGSDWCWWFGPENSSANDADFDAIFRNHLAAVYYALGQPAPDALAQPIKHAYAPAATQTPECFLEIKLDGRESSFFEWLGAGLYSPERRGGAMHGRTWILGSLRFGFSPDALFLRVDPVEGGFSEIRNGEFRIVIRGSAEIRITVEIVAGQVAACSFGSDAGSTGATSAPEIVVVAALDKILEVRIARSIVPAVSADRLFLTVSFWEGGLPLDFLPAEGPLEILLGDAESAWGGTSG